MFDSIDDETLNAARDAARLLYDRHRDLGLDPAIKLDTLCADITAELEDRGWPAEGNTADDGPAGFPVLVVRYRHLTLTYNAPASRAGFRPRPVTTRPARAPALVPPRG